MVPFAGPHQDRATAAGTGQVTASSAMRAAVVAGTGAWVFYWIGSSRAFSYDGAVSVKNFIATPSVFDAFRKHVVFNNHPLLSFLEHLVFDATGSRSEMVIRVLPVTFAAATIGLTLWLLCRPFGMRAVCAGTLLLAVNPVFLGNAREVRGYRLLTFARSARPHSWWRTRPPAGASPTDWWSRPERRRTCTCSRCCSAMQRSSRRRGERLRDWSGAWACAVVVAVLVELPAIGSVSARSSVPPRVPLQLAYNIAGGNVAAAILTGAVLVLAGAACRRRSSYRTVVGAVGAAAATVVAVLWLWAPDDLYVRMFVWLVPAVALAGAFVVRLRRGAAALVLAAAVATLAPQVGHLATPELANRAVKQYVTAIRRPDDTVCGLGETQGLGPYTFPFTTVASPVRLPGCAIVFMLMPRATAAPLRQAARIGSRSPVGCPPTHRRSCSPTGGWPSARPEPAAVSRAAHPLIDAMPTATGSHRPRCTRPRDPHTAPPPAPQGRIR